MSEEYKDFKKEQDYEIDTLTNERLIKDHVYDGIRELDNDLPPWWNWLFIISVIFGVIYLVRIWGFESPDLLQENEFNKEMAQAASMAPAKSEELNMVALTEAGDIAIGKEIYGANCAVCHLADGGGLIGPNFTDDNWIHGNSIEALFDVVTNGVLEKGMTPFKDQMNPKKRLQVISYILTLHGTTPATPKAAEGDVMEWPY